MTGPAIVLEGISKAYRLYGRPSDRLREALLPWGRSRHRDFYALKDVSLRVEPGEIVGIVGRNGSGKSTLLRVVTGVTAPTAGRRDVRGTMSALLELGTGFHPDLTGLQNIYLNGAILGHSRATLDRLRDEILEFAEIGEFAAQPVRTYSTGMLVRLAFSLAVTVDPDVLVVDEALSVGDAPFQRKCYARMERFLESGRTVLLVTHNLDLVAQLCRRAVLMDGGEILLDGPPKRVRGAYFRLLRASDRDRERVREEVRALGAGSGAAAGGEPGAPEPEGGALEFYSPDLETASEAGVALHDVEIREVALRTAAGERVNHVAVDGEYVLSWLARFGVAAEGVSFGVTVRTVTGVTVSTVQAPGRAPARAFGRIEAGEACRVDCRFLCRLLPGTFYVNVFVRGSVGGGERGLLARVGDALAFRVQGPPDTPYSGLVHLDQRAEITKLPPPGARAEELSLLRAGERVRRQL